MNSGSVVSDSGIENLDGIPVSRWQHGETERVLTFRSSQRSLSIASIDLPNEARGIAVWRGEVSPTHL